MMRGLLGAAALVLIAACTPEVKAPTAEEIAAESARLTQFLDAAYEEALQRSPESLTYLGRKERYGEFDDRTEAAADAELAWLQANVAEMKSSFDYEKLDEESKTSFDVWATGLTDAELGMKHRRHGYIFIRSGPHSELANFLINFHGVDEKSDMEAYVSRLTKVDDALDVHVQNATLAAADGVRPPLFAFDQALEEARKVVSGAPFTAGPDSPLFADAKAKIAALKDSGKITAEEAVALEGQAREALTGELKPGYDRLIAWLGEERMKVPEEAKGAWSLPDGAAYYNNMLKLMTTTDQTAESIHELGLSEVARIHGEMEKIKEQVGFAGTLVDFFTFVRTDDQFHLPETDEGRAQYIKMAEDYLAAMETKLPEYFGILPKAGLVVKRVETFREEAGGAQHYYPGTPDGSRPGVFYAHLSDMKAMPTYELEAIAYHEGNPGHHMQISIAQELTGIPQFRTQAGHTAYIEGWALYTETLAKEMGFYTDPYSDYGRLSAELWRAIRLVVDTGLHAKGWSEEEAVDYFLTNSSVPEAAVRSEIRRYIVWPGQATAYKIGMLKIQELRAAAQAELGDKFTMGGFHDTVLGGGSLPLPVLEARVQRWVETVKAAPL
jgi:uncharacterized protein (DUF885 family)